MSLGKTELSALTRMFSATVVRELGRAGESPLLARLLTQTGLAHDLHPGATLGDAYDHAFMQLSALGNRDEYVYRSAITQKILLGQHNLRTASLLSEARVGSSKADLVVLNGTATAYEIKSERDSLARLASQVSSYQEVFAAVNVVTSPSHAARVLALVPSEVGVLVLSRRFTLQTERAAVVDPSRTNPSAVLDLLRAGEAISILRELGVQEPQVPNTKLRTTLTELFATLEPAALHRQMVVTLKRTRSQHAAAEVIHSIPISLRAAILALKLGRPSQQNVRDATGLPLRAALGWS